MSASLVAGDVGGTPSARTIVVWMVMFSVAGGAAAGFFVGWLYGQDQAVTAAGVLGYGAEGLVLGAVIGGVAALPPAWVLSTLQRRTAIAAPVRVVVAAMSAAVEVSAVVLVVTGFSVVAEAVVFCAAAVAVPAGLAATCLTLRSRRAGRRPGLV